jgi:hypothetical protein
MGHESLSLGVVLNTHNLGTRLSLVNNVAGNHT